MSYIQDELIPYARSYLGIPYQFGGKTRYGSIDCSGLICDILKKPGVLPMTLNLNAQGLFEYLCKTINVQPLKQAESGSILFFGASISSIHHVAMAVNSKEIIESGGGNNLTLTLEQAIALNAGVREIPIAARPNRVAILMPQYPQL